MDYYVWKSDRKDRAAEIRRVRKLKFSDSPFCRALYDWWLEQRRKKRTG